MELSLFSDGKPKTIKAEKRTITFKTTTPKKLSAKGKISGLAIQALEALGKNAVTQEIIIKLTKILQKEDKEIIKQDAKLAPQSVAQILFSITEK